MKDGTKARLNEISKALHVTAAQEEMCEGAKLTPRKKKNNGPSITLLWGLAGGNKLWVVTV